MNFNFIGLTSHWIYLMPIWSYLRLFIFTITIPVFLVIIVATTIMPNIANIWYLLIYPNDGGATIISGIYQRIQIVMGIYMLFQLTIELIKMLANPDNIADKEKGIYGMLKRSVIAILLLVLINPIFANLYKIQDLVLSSNLIGKIINLKEDTNYGKMDKENFILYGYELSWATMNTFYYFTPGDEVACGHVGTENFTKNFFSKSTLGGFITGGIGGAIANSLMTAATDWLLSDGVNGVINLYNRAIVSESFYAALATQIASGQSDILTKNQMNVMNNILKTGEIKQGDFDTMFSSIYTAPLAFGPAGACSVSIKKINTNYETYEYTMSYYPILAFCFTAYIAFLLLSNCVALALRASQLLFLQIIAPIAILSYIGKKDGALTKWIAQCIDAYLDVFLRIAAVYFAIYLLHVINKSDATIINNLSGIIPTGNMSETFAKYMNNQLGTFLYRFGMKPLLMIGILKFSKKAPEMVKELFPRKSAAALDYMSPDKQVVGTVGGMVVSGLTMAAGNTINRVKNSRNAENSLRKEAEALGEKHPDYKKKIDEANRLKRNRGRDAFKGLSSGLLRGSVQGGYKGYKGGIAGAFSGAIASNKEYDKWLQAGGESEFGRVGAAFANYFGLATPYQNDQVAIEAQEQALSGIKDTRRDLQHIKGATDSAKNVIQTETAKGNTVLLNDGVENLTYKITNANGLASRFEELRRLNAENNATVSIKSILETQGLMKDGKIIDKEVVGKLINDNFEKGTTIDTEFSTSKIYEALESTYKGLAKKTQDDITDMLDANNMIVTLFGDTSRDNDLSKKIKEARDNIKVRAAYDEQFESLLKGKMIKLNADTNKYEIGDIANLDDILKEQANTLVEAINKVRTGKEFINDSAELDKLTKALKELNKRTNAVEGEFGRMETAVTDAITAAKKDPKYKAHQADNNNSK